jgi:hypothetical protein
MSSQFSLRTLPPDGPDVQRNRTLAEKSTLYFSRLAIEIIKKEENQVLPEEWMLATGPWKEGVDGYELNSLKLQELTKPSQKNSLSPKSPSKFARDPGHDRGKYLFAHLETSHSWQRLQEDVKVIENLQFPLVFREKKDCIDVIIFLKDSMHAGPIQNRVCQTDKETIMPLKQVDQITRRKDFKSESPVINKQVKEVNDDEKEIVSKNLFQNIMDESKFLASTDPNEWTLGPKLFEEVKVLKKESKKKKIYFRIGTPKLSRFWNKKTQNFSNL